MLRALAIVGLSTLLGVESGCVARSSPNTSAPVGASQARAPGAAREEGGSPPVVRPDDRDSDGVPDFVDACPDLPEDRDDFEDDDGCPDRDNDGDGIPDAHEWLGDRWSNCDQQTVNGVTYDCRNVPEDFDGEADHDGCWDESICYPPTLGVAPVYDPETLRFADAEVDAAFAEAAQALAERPDATLTLTGYSGPLVSTQTDRRRSLEAAEALRRALVRRGLPARRIEVRGIGDASEGYDYQSAEERRVNFRVELVGSWGCETKPTKSRAKAQELRARTTAGPARLDPPPGRHRMDPLKRLVCLLVLTLVLPAACKSGEGDTATATGGDDSVCKLPCASADDCGGAASLVDCVAGYCEYVGCDADADCSGGSVCRVIDGVSVCLVDCTGDADCAMIYTMKCVADDNGDNYCDYDPGPGGCAEDRDCEGNGGICDAQAGECHCSDDASCEAASVCI
ncbi:MAG: hypothetical protein KC486_14715 [Myxococcales bacterium]|nr:hypothetical protein [Myxococcales bacterium]